MNGFDWGIVLDAGVGLGVFLIGLGSLIVCSALSRTLGRLNETLDEVDRQLASVSEPVTRTLGHIDGIANTADVTIARLQGVVGQLETVASGAGKVTSLAVEAVSPAIVNMGATLAGISVGIRRLVTRRPSANGDAASERVR
ncbi:MAG TPA: hypothetical protein VN603_08540 [Candidatus Acidoferrales bacterium]|nr:hypothetical protein [Candidatus Acidoferrales bacterium]